MTKPPLKTVSLPLVQVLCLALLAGCSAPPETGSARFAVSVPSSLSASVSRVSITTRTAAFPSLSVEILSTELSSSHGSWGGLLGHLPTGSRRTFLAQAFDSSGTLLSQGSAFDVSLSSHQTALVTITLQEPEAAEPPRGMPPGIDSPVASVTRVLR